jgi:hypothetical protein
VHPSATNDVHAMQALPIAPQLPSAGASQFAPAQQPDAQLVLVHDVHVPVRQFCDVGHVEQSDPPVPQYVFVLPCSQVAPLPVPLQQPFGHDVPSQMHSPETQCWPVTQADPVPQVQAPLVLQVSVRPPHVLHVPPWVPHVVSV